jgi:hypothetical protein
MSGAAQREALGRPHLPALRNLGHGARRSQYQSEFRSERVARTTALRPACANASEGGSRAFGLPAPVALAKGGLPYDSGRQGGGPVLWPASFRRPDGAIKFARASDGVLTQPIPQSGTGDQTVRRSPDPAIREWPDLVSDGLTDRMVRPLTDSSARRPAYSW